MTKIKHELHQNINASNLMISLTQRFGWLLLLVLLLTSGCDKAYRYAFFPPERVEYTLVPDQDLLHLSGDTSYSISRDSTAVIYDRKSYKVEVKYLSNYQLDNFEFADDSKDGEFSANPFTYAGWVDPQLGYTPSRFTVFKVSIYNYASSKLNLDPELSFLVSDRGDVLPGYGREEKSSRNQSIEGYFRKRKGSSGVDDEIFERRMGIVRQTVLYLGRPIFQGDSREGIVVYDPLNESVDKVKLVMKNFIVGYDENNEPSEYADLQFYFKRTPLVKERLKSLVPDSTLVASRKQATPNALHQENLELHQIHYRTEEDAGSTNQDWNIKPNALNALASFLKDSLSAKVTVKISPADSPDLMNARIGFMFVGPTKPTFSDVEVLSLANMIKRGGFLFVDNAAFSSNYQYYDNMVALLQNIASKLDRQVRVIPIPNDHQIYKAWQKLTGPPQGTDDIENMPDKKNFLQGLFWRDQLVALVSSKGYSMIWDKQDRSQLKQFTLGANVVVYASSTLRPH